ncbi:hypothetical protein QQF64_029219 [Cirrhinus molitorella]|uniref:Uncharacterized protein n=1 Tax=Cirrhinus molitorella TaxID=172907 RepID=A0ABR3N9E4_9TELE
METRRPIHNDAARAKDMVKRQRVGGWAIEYLLKCLQGCLELEQHLWLSTTKQNSVPSRHAALKSHEDRKQPLFSRAYMKALQLGSL